MLKALICRSTFACALPTIKNTFTCICIFFKLYTLTLSIYPLINNGNWTEWSAIWSEIIRVISKSNEHGARIRFEITSMILDQNCTTQSLNFKMGVTKPLKAGDISSIQVKGDLHLKLYLAQKVRRKLFFNNKEILHRYMSKVNTHYNDLIEIISFSQICCILLQLKKRWALILNLSFFTES